MRGDIEGFAPPRYMRTGIEDRLMARIIEARRARYMTQGDVARKTGLSTTTIYYWEEGINYPASIGHWQALARAVGLSFQIRFGDPLFHKEEDRIAHRMRMHRLVNGLKGSDVVEKLGCGHNQVSQWERFHSFPYTFCHMMAWAKAVKAPKPSIQLRPFKSRFGRCPADNCFE